MVMRRGRPRVGRVRATVATVEVLILTALAHVWAGGALPSPPWFAGMALVVFSVSLLVLRGSLRVSTAVAMIAVCQVGLHVTFEMGAAQGGHAGHVAGDGGAPTGPMLLAHVLATVGTALILFLQDRAASRVDALLNPSVRWVVPMGLRRVRAFPHVSQQLSKSLRVLLLRSPLRGPPVSAV